jgi:hypothetical protein
MLAIGIDQASNRLLSRFAAKTAEHQKVVERDERTTNCDLTPIRKDASAVLDKDVSGVQIVMDDSVWNG